jgi:hypothetical protein
MGPWTEVSVAALETLLAWGVFLLLGRGAVMRRLHIVSAALRDAPQAGGAHGV